MRNMKSVMAAMSAALLIGAALISAQGPDRQTQPATGTERPGQATKGQVWIENRGRSESIPITAPQPIPVTVQNPIRQWDYYVLPIALGLPAAELQRTLTTAGTAGWETAGVQIAMGSSTLIVMKRPRPDGRVEGRRAGER